MNIYLHTKTRQDKNQQNNMGSIAKKKLYCPYFVIPRGFEPRTHSLEGCCSIQLSYGTDTASISDTN